MCHRNAVEADASHHKEHGNDLAREGEVHLPPFSCSHRHCSNSGREREQLLRAIRGGASPLAFRMRISASAAAPSKQPAARRINSNPTANDSRAHEAR